MTTPDWINIVQEKLKSIDLSKFPSRIWITSKVIKPQDNKFVPKWALCVSVELEIKFRDTGKWTSLSTGEGVYLYSSKNFEQIIYCEIERLLCHELKECFQIKDPGAVKGEMTIPFDPHNKKKRVRITYSSYDKIDVYRHYPSWRALLQSSTARWLKLNSDMLRGYYTSRFRTIKSGFNKPLFA